MPYSVLCQPLYTIWLFHNLIFNYVAVIISPSLRGNGLGRMLMTGCESFAAKKGFHIIYLSTHDKEKFYAFLGYELCEAIHFYGGRPSLKPQKVFIYFH